MNLVSLYEPDFPLADEGLPPLPSREESVAELALKPNFDVVIVGATLQGAICAYLLALNGARTLLIDQSDLGSSNPATRPRIDMIDGPEKLLQIGTCFNYLEIAAGIQRAMPSFCDFIPAKCLGEIPPRNTFVSSVWKLACRLKSWKGELPEAFLKNSDTVALRYDPSRVIATYLLAARQEGAYCINYAGLDRVINLSDTEQKIAINDFIAGRKINVSSVALIDCSYKAVAIGRKGVRDSANKVPYNRRCVEFELETPTSLREPISISCDALRISIVSVTSNRTQVSTTKEIAIQTPEVSEQEINEILSAINSHAPELSRATLVSETVSVRDYIYGVPAEYSASNGWAQDGEIFWCFYSGLIDCVNRAVKLLPALGIDSTQRPALERLLPGGRLRESLKERFLLQGLASGIKESQLSEICARYGGRIRHFVDNPYAFEPAGPITRGEVDLLSQDELVLSAADLAARLRRRFSDDELARIDEYLKSRNAEM